MRVTEAYPSDAETQNWPMARPYCGLAAVAIAAYTGMKLDENRPTRETTMTNSSGLVKSGKIANPPVCARKERRRIFLPFPVLSRIPPQSGESTIVSIAGTSASNEMRKKVACKSLR